MEIIQTSTVDGLLEQLDVRREREPYLVVNTMVTGTDRFVAALRAAELLLADFDGTLHPGSQWADLKARMPGEIAAEDTAAAQAFFALERPTLDDELALLFGSIERMRRARFTREVVMLAARNSSPPRDGADALIRSFFSTHVCIVSFGLHDYIHEWCDLPRLWRVNIAALRLQWMDVHQQAELVGSDWQTAVVGTNKGFVGAAFCAARGVHPSKVLALGDSPIDLSMMHPGNVGVLLIPHEDMDEARRHYRHDGLGKMWSSISAVLVSDSLDPLVELRVR